MESTTPLLLLAKQWDGDMDPTGWHMSEKLDGVRAYWTGTHFVSRAGNRFNAPVWFVAGLPSEPLDGELWAGRGEFQDAANTVMSRDESERWREIKFVIFDAPTFGGEFESRIKRIEEILQVDRPAYAEIHRQTVCESREHLQSEFERIEKLGGEGIMLRQPGSAYVAGRSKTLLKVKRFHDAEATVVGMEVGKGKHKGRMGALLVELDTGVRFALGSGFSDFQRENPPSAGTRITFKYQEILESGVPRFGSFLRVRIDS